MSNRQEIEAIVDQVSQLLHRKIGLRPEPSLRGRLHRCIRDDALVHGKNLDAYLDTLLAGGDALQDLLNRVTVQETAFFRHPEHFELLAAEVLPGLRPPVTLWSAACANGQEAFSLAMLLDELGLDGSVIATDLSTDALLRTSTARYSTRELSGLSPRRRARHLTRDGDSWLINRNLRDRVSTLQHNLLHPLPSQVRSCQVVFCRNVLIYFSPDHARAFLDRVADALPAASLFLGAAETIWQLSSRFETVRSGDTFSYRRRADSSPAGIPDPVRPSSPAGTATAVLATAVLATPVPATPVLLAQAGQRASAAGDAPAAVVAFRKCAYLAPDDPMAHLHLGLALESAGDQPSAQRAYAAARRALTRADPANTYQGIEGYTTADLIRLLDSKQQPATA